MNAKTKLPAVIIDVPPQDSKVEFSPELVQLGHEFVNLHSTFENSKEKLLTALEVSHGYMVKCGLFLKDTKPKVGHGQWLPWLKHCAKINERTAQHYIQQVSNTKDLADLDDKKVVDTYVELELIAPPQQKKPKKKKETPEKSDLLKIKGLVLDLWTLLESTPDKSRAALELKCLNDWQTKIEEMKKQDAAFDAD